MDGKKSKFIYGHRRTARCKTQALKFCFNPIQIKESQLFADYENQLAEYRKSNSENSENNKEKKKPILKGIY
jgi:hypothetical protein